MDEKMATREIRELRRRPFRLYYPYPTHASLGLKGVRPDVATSLLVGRAMRYFAVGL